MTESTDSVKNNEVIEDAKKGQHISGTTQDVLKAIGSESEQAKLSTNKLSDQLTSGTLNTKPTNHDSDNILDETIKDQIPTITDSDLKSPTDRSDQGYKSSSNHIGMCSESPCNRRDTGSDNLVNMSPECMYSVVQQKAQNVLKMLSPENDVKVTEGTPQSEKESITNKELSVNKPQSVQKKSNENANLKCCKISKKSSNDSSEHKISCKNNKTSIHEKLSSKSGSKHDNLKLHTDAQEKNSKENTNKTPDGKNQFVPTSESQQSNRSTEQCTTDYCTKNSSNLENISNEKMSRNENDNSQTTGILSQQCGGGIPVISDNSNECGQDGKNQPTSDVIKELSQIIDSDEGPVQLTKQGELISQLFKQKFLYKLEASGNLDESSAEIANLTAAKFAKWMEDILKEIDVRKKQQQESKKQTVNVGKDTKEEKDHEDEFFSAASSKGSITIMEDLTQANEEESPEIVKIQELSDTDLIAKFGTHLLKESKHELFQFIGPDNVPVEVRHLNTVESKKVMIVKKKTSATHWSNWVIEVGPEVTLESVSGSVSQCKEVSNEESENEKLKGSDEGMWNLRKLTWENWKPNIFKDPAMQRKVPILKKQCKITEQDHDIEYPAYPFLATQFEKPILDGNINISHQAKQSPSFE